MAALHPPAATCEAHTDARLSLSRRPSISLVVATVDRTEELARLFASLAAERMRDFEVIVVDQNDDERLVPVLREFERAFTLSRLRCQRGLSRSRNAGLAHARGDIVGFPDDDARYEGNTLSRVHAFFAGNPGVGGLTGRALADPRDRATPRFARRARWVTPEAAWTCGISCTMFFRRALVERIGGFDERLGLGSGTRWLAGEEADLLLRALESGARVRYDPSLTVRHPGHRGAFTDAARIRGATYGRGMGFVMRRHGMTSARFAYQLLRPAGGAVLAMLGGQIDRARFHLAVGRGRLRGWRDAQADRGPA
jgi:GT2 family glycosyltransferase